MVSSHEPEALRATLQFLIASDIPSEHKTVLMEALTQALRSHIPRQSVETAAGPWQLHETTLLQSFLAGKSANSWQHADEMLMRLASDLHRQPGDVRAKATELGLGVGVDYRLARASARAREE